ncbi:5-methylthioribose kinase MtnK [Gottschalkia acidurici 9a]|uniref:S-methyl-5-thioribose kinase n=1 Tax=Gottschalkia acidurici (strain ATCC 7906 / DSM 604 / BCRC 14475 / CIP 104303 / KCTC 5404 / NCIMB 10678 / 9a) TaxID=1128398 RepID=K0B4Y9_GOTA9|nr:S-methyl-5-thioribose kinase [Gottschalkia acidurici]AFS79631.1 5-methylthioribose kinase MtnK [Gottschalkia acidurici 9a]
MSKFNEKFLMNTDEVIEYVLEKTDIFRKDDNLKCVEFGDGNVNYIFKIWNEKTEKSIILKQAGPTARASEEFKFSPDRNRTEANLLKLQGELAPGSTPKIYHIDTVMNCFIMEDLSDHEVLRTSLLNHKKVLGFTDLITTFLVNSLIMTTDIVMSHKEKRELNQDYINPVLCEITKDVVYTEPFTNYLNRNSIFEANKDWVIEHYYRDEELKLEVAKIKYEFMNNAQALVHGDLHSGSIFVKDNSVKVIDPEFAFYGPIGHDLGNLIAHLIFAWVNADANIEDVKEKEDYKKWLEDSIVEIIDMFKTKFLKSFKENAKDISTQSEEFDKWYLDSILDNTSGVVGIELSRRIIGIPEAKIKDIESINCENSRVKAERICLATAKNFIKNRKSFKSGIDFVNNLKEIEKLY